MSVRLVVTINAAPGKGATLARALRERCLDVMKEPGCEEFEVFQSVLNPVDRHRQRKRWRWRGGCAGQTVMRRWSIG